MIVQNLKGFRDFLPKEARKRQYVINTLKKVFESYGFEPLETPALEYEEVLIGKYGEEGDKLMYRFEDNGKRRVAMRYDQTVPLSRVVAQYQNELPLPFKRYQIQNVYRAENTQKGRFREFLQCDIDTVGPSSILSDAEIVMIIIESFKKLHFKNFKVIINDRENLKFSQGGMELSPDKNIAAIRAIDKLKKIGQEGVVSELIEKGFPKSEALDIVETSLNTKPTKRLEEIMSILKSAGFSEKYFEFSATLARGMDYYTGIILEVEVDEYPTGSLGGGGRYDNLIGMFAGKQIPAVGFAFGFDRVMEAMEELNLFPPDLQGANVLVTIFSKDLAKNSIDISSLLRESNINTELYSDENAKMDKQLKYANQKQIPYVVILGPEEIEKNIVTLKNMKTGEQTKDTLTNIIPLLSQA